MLKQVLDIMSDYNRGRATSRGLSAIAVLFVAGA